jgi:hypothetical protein
VVVSEHNEEPEDWGHDDCDVCDEARVAELVGLKTRIVELEEELEEQKFQGNPVKGAEAEELRERIEKLIESNPNKRWAASLQRLLDDVDARDSLTFLERHPEIVRLKAELAEAKRIAALLPEWARAVHVAIEQQAPELADSVAAYFVGLELEIGLVGITDDGLVFVDDEGDMYKKESISDAVAALVKSVRGQE